MPTEPGRVEILALAGLPEVVEGDDLERMIGDALEATPGALPLRGRRRPGRDPEGRVQGRGRGRRPADGHAGPEAIAWAEHWDRDPRQIQVVLDEAARSCAWSAAC